MSDESKAQIVIGLLRIPAVVRRGEIVVPNRWWSLVAYWLAVFWNGKVVVYDE